MQHFISIVVPFHNNRNEIQLCCESLINQAYPSDRYEIIFVDNNSRDSSPAIVSTFPSILLLQQPVQGSYAARNLGIRAAKGQLIAFTDADCVAASDWLQQINAAMHPPAVRLILGAYSGSRAKFPASALSAYENAKNRYIFQGQDQSLYYGYTNNMAVRPSVFDQFGFFSEVARGGDVMLVRKVLDHDPDSKVSIQYVGTMFVDHLEFNRVFSYYGKVFVHSRSVGWLRGQSLMRPLTSTQRHRAFRDMLVVEQYSLLQAILIYLVMALGMLLWIVGSIIPLHQTPGTPERGQ